MQLNILCFVIGAWLLQQQPALPQLAWAWALALPAAAWFLPAERGRAHWFTRQAALKAGFLAAGFLWAAAFAAWRLADALSPEWEGRDVELIGVVADLPRSNDASTRFEFDVEQVLTAGAVVPRHVALSWFRERDMDAPPSVRAGERWRLGARLKRPHGSANPHGFDLEAWALERNLRASGYVRRAEGWCNPPAARGTSLIAASTNRYASDHYNQHGSVGTQKLCPARLDIPSGHVKLWAWLKPWCYPTLSASRRLVQSPTLNPGEW